MQRQVMRQREHQYLKTACTNECRKDSSFLHLGPIFHLMWLPNSEEDKQFEKKQLEKSYHIMIIMHMIGYNLTNCNCILL